MLVFMKWMHMVKIFITFTRIREGEGAVHAEKLVYFNFKILCFIFNVITWSRENPNLISSTISVSL